jgi:hypothetical protein
MRLPLVRWPALRRGIVVGVAALVLASCARPAPTSRQVRRAPASPISDRMDTFEINGYVLAGAAYWPYIGKDELRYPDEVLWGFYPVRGEIAKGEITANPESASREAIACAEQAFSALQVFLARNPPALRRVVQLGERRGAFTPRFYLWINDYSRAADPYPHGVREARLWYWQRNEPAAGKPPGYWKWEASLLQDGKCHVPRAGQIEQYLDETLATLEGRPQVPGDAPGVAPPHGEPAPQD